MNSHNRNSLPEQRNSGSPEWRVPLSETCFNDEEVVNVTRVLRSGWWTSGPETRALEQDWENYLDAGYAMAVSSGTAALHLAFQALGLGTGDEVIVPSLNFVAAANTILHFGAIPHFVDVDSVSTPLVSKRTIESAINEKTRGIVVMHYGGYPCSMEPIVQLARQHGLWVVEDAAHAPGAALNGIPCGTWGDIGCFSFFGNKNISCGEGGLVVTRNESVAKRLQLFRSHGMSSLTWDRFRGHNFSYDVTVPGFNFRMDDLRAALLRVQLRSLDRYNELRRQRVSWYLELLGGDARWEIPFRDYGGTPSCHLFVIVLNESLSRQSVMARLKSAGIQSSIHYPPTHQLSCYRNRGIRRPDMSVTEDLGRRILTLPLFPGMTQEQVQIVCEAFRDSVDATEVKIETRKMA